MQIAAKVFHSHSRGVDQQWLSTTPFNVWDQLPCYLFLCGWICLTSYSSTQNQQMRMVLQCFSYSFPLGKSHWKHPFYNVFQRIHDGMWTKLLNEDYCPDRLLALIEKCWAMNAIDCPQFPIVCQLSMDYKAISFWNIHMAERMYHQNIFKTIAYGYIR